MSEQAKGTPRTVWIVSYFPDGPDVDLTPCESEEAAYRQAIEYVATDLDNIALDANDLAVSIAAMINMGDYRGAVDAWNAYSNDNGFALYVDRHDVCELKPRPYLDLKALERLRRA